MMNMDSITVVSFVDYVLAYETFQLHVMLNSRSVSVHV